MTEFEQVVCWQRDRTYAVLNPDAEHIDDDVFFATHTDLPLSLQEISPDTRPGLEPRRWTMQFEEFLDQFLSPSRPHVQVVVLGDAGSGKSHFIHWLALHVPEQAGRYVLNIPRSGLSLRGVVERILGVLPTDQQAKYRERLDRSGFQTVGREGQRSRLLAEIALAIEADQSEDETEEILLSGLPHLFRDPNYAMYLRTSGGVVDDLIAHIAESPGYDRREQRRSFDTADLPLEAVDIGLLAARTRLFMGEIRGNPDFIEPAIGIINRNLDRAIGQVLNFTGDQLIELMREMRRYLRGAGKNLVLLIEDFARLQGIDYALLQALIESAAADDDLCEIRWAMAMTTGYYRRTVDTVRTRMDFVIDMDLPTRGREAVFDDERILSFASRYLNAVRLTSEDLRGWRESAIHDADSTDPPNACVPCVYRPRCHQAFGEAQGIGLYPFNRQAIIEMTHRVDPDLQERFNPRLLIKGVLAEVLGNRLHEFDQKVFPSERFLESMRGTSLQPVMLERLERASPEHAKRQAAVLELWGTPGQIAEVDPGVYEAFGLPKPAVETIPTVPPPPGPATSGGKQSAPPDALVEAVRAWGRGDRMADPVAARLRDLLFTALVGYVDWDGAGIQQSWAASKSGSTPFRSRSIVFQRQVTSPAIRGIVLRVPATTDASDLRQASIGLEGLVEFQRSGAWSFPDAELKFISLRRSLDTWSTDVLDQLRAMVRPDGNDTVAQAIALLAIGVAMAGDMDDDTPAMEKLTNSLFEPWPAQSSAQSPTWRRLYREIRDQRERLIEIARAWASGSKGGQVGAFLDGHRLAQVLSSLRSTWRLGHSPPGDDEGSIQDPVGRLYGRASQDLSVAVDEEISLVRSWLEGTRHTVAETTSGKVLQAALKEVRQTASAAGLQVSKTSQDAFDAALEGFGPTLFDRAIQQSARVAGEEDPLRVLPSIGSARMRTAMDATTLLLLSADRYLSQIEASIATREDNLEQRSADVDRDRQRIEAALDQLVSVLQLLGPPE